MWEISPEAVITIGFVLVCAIAGGFAALFNAVFRTPPKPPSPPSTADPEVEWLINLHNKGVTDIMTPREQQREAQQKIGYGPIWLRRVGDAVIVEVEATADRSGEPRWVEVIREHYAGNFDHCVEPLGILEQVEKGTKR